MHALESAGCHVSLPRNFCCEKLGKNVVGGYDDKTKQVIITSDPSNVPNSVEHTLAHELLHMYDHCTNELTCRSVEELACTEIRAANLANCRDGLIDGLMRSEVYENRRHHAKCVEERAASSVRSITGLSKAKSFQIVARVFDRCYSDLEPVGRRCHNRTDEMLALKEFLWLNPHIKTSSNKK